jgi:hypothetical protein
MKWNFASAVATGFFLCLCAGAAQAQTQGGPQASMPGQGVSTVPMGAQQGRTMTTDQFNQLQDYADLAHRLTKEDKAQGKTLDQLLAEDKENAAKLTATMPLSCDVSQAILAAQGPVTVDGQTVATKTFEVACANGMGYFLISQEPGKPYGISCFEADATRAADISAGRPPGLTCNLPPNASTNAMAMSIMTRSGTPCTVRDHRWVGQSSATNTEFDEVACDNDAGYMLAVAIPGSNQPVRVTSCHDSALHGLPCKLSSNGAPVVTLQTFLDALAQHNIACAAGDSDVRVIGQENVQKRYVVEFRCAQRPAGVVAFIPLSGGTAPFEAVDCPAAAKRGVKCTLSTTN